MFGHEPQKSAVLGAFLHSFGFFFPFLMPLESLRKGLVS
jgi:hypothetical protein